MPCCETRICRFIAVETTLSITDILRANGHAKQGRCSSTLPARLLSSPPKSIRLYLLKYGFIPVEVARLVRNDTPCV